MKRSLLALASLVAVGTASAQSSVTLFGVLDADVQHLSNSGGASITRAFNSGLSFSRLGFRGVEGLGSGLSASFWLEAGMNNNNGSGAPTSTNNQVTGVVGSGGLTFNRRSTVSLSGRWGELRLGRDYTPQFWNLSVGDPFSTTGLGTTQTLNAIAVAGGAGGMFNNPVAARASNSIGYLTPASLGGLYGQAMIYRGNNASNAVVPASTTSASAATGGPAAPAGSSIANDGNGYGVRIGFAQGPANIAAAIGRTRYAAGDVHQENVFGSWNFGFAQVMGAITRDSVPTIKGHGWQIGTLIPIGVSEIRAAVSQYGTNVTGNPKSRKYALGYAYNFSKRTAIYATYARISNSGGAFASVAPGANGNPTINSASSGFDIGIRHAF